MKLKAPLMSKKIRNIILFSIVTFSSAAFAGVLMSQWTEGTTRFCKYSDGEVIAVSFGSICPSTK
jgi:hypothetical protein